MLGRNLGASPARAPGTVLASRARPVDLAGPPPPREVGAPGPHFADSPIHPPSPAPRA